MNHFFKHQMSAYPSLDRDSWAKQDIRNVHITGTREYLGYDKRSVKISKFGYYPDYDLKEKNDIMANARAARSPSYNSPKKQTFYQKQLDVYIFLLKRNGIKYPKNVCEVNSIHAQISNGTYTEQVDVDEDESVLLDDEEDFSIDGTKLLSELQSRCKNMGQGKKFKITSRAFFFASKHLSFCY